MINIHPLGAWMPLQSAKCTHFNTLFGLLFSLYVAKYANFEHQPLAAGKCFYTLIPQGGISPSSFPRIEQAGNEKPHIVRWGWAQVDVSRLVWDNWHQRLVLLAIRQRDFLFQQKQKKKQPPQVSAGTPSDGFYSQKSPCVLHHSSVQCEILTSCLLLPDRRRSGVTLPFLRKLHTGLSWSHTQDVVLSLAVSLPVFFLPQPVTI